MPDLVSLLPARYTGASFYFHCSECARPLEQRSKAKALLYLSSTRVFSNLITKLYYHNGYYSFAHAFVVSMYSLVSMLCCSCLCHHIPVPLSRTLGYGFVLCGQSHHATLFTGSVEVFSSDCFIFAGRSFSTDEMFALLCHKRTARREICHHSLPFFSSSPSLDSTTEFSTEADAIP